MPLPAETIAVRFDNGQWRVHGQGLGPDLAFDRVLDAERLALGLAGNRPGLVVDVYDETDRLRERYT